MTTVGQMRPDGPTRFIGAHPRASRSFVHGAAISSLLGVIAMVAAGEASGSLLVTWVLAYAILALLLELIIRGGVTKPAKFVSAGDNETALRAIDPVDQLIAASDRVELLSGTLKTFAERSANVRALRDRCRAGALVRVLLMAPGSDGVMHAAAERRARGLSTDSDDLDREIVESIKRLLFEFSPSVLAGVLRLYTGGAHSAVQRFGDRYVVTVYTLGRGGSSPTFTIQRSQHEDFCDGLDRGFEELWNASSTLRVDETGLRRIVGVSPDDSPR